MLKTPTVYRGVRATSQAIARLAYRVPDIAGCLGRRPGEHGGGRASPARTDVGERPTANQAGQAMTEYLIVVGALLAGGIGAGLFGENGGLLGMLIDALRGFHHRFSMTLSLPL